MTRYSSSGEILTGHGRMIARGGAKPWACQYGIAMGATGWLPSDNMGNPMTRSTLWGGMMPSSEVDQAGRLVPFQDLVGRQEISVLLEVTVSAVDTWRQRHPDFPAPIVVLSGTPVWRWTAVQAWHRTHPRKPGRPRKSSRGVNG